MKTLAFAAFGMIVGILFSVLFVVITAVAGPFPDAYGGSVTAAEATLMYVLGCTAAAVLASLFSPLFSSNLGTVFVGIVGVTPPMLGAYLVFYGWEMAPLPELIVAAFGTVVVGAGLGWFFRNAYRELRAEFGSDDGHDQRTPKPNA